MKKHIVIAIDGPAGTGKSTTAREVARQLGISYLDSGALYRAYTLELLSKGVKLEDKKAISSILATSRLRLRNGDNGCLVYLNGRDVTHEIRSEEVTANVSAVASLSEVREAVNSSLRRIAEDTSVAVDGRDIGTTVFPAADLKIYLQASLQERAKRRCRDLKAAGHSANIHDVQKEIERRDKQDSERSISPLSKAQDAVVLDTTRLSFEEGVNLIIDKARKLLSESSKVRKNP